MELAIIVFISVVVAMCVFAVPMVIIDMVHTIKEDKRKKLEAKEEVAPVAPVEEQVSKEGVKTIEIEESKDAIIINKNAQLTLEEKYLKLDDQNKKYYDGIVLRGGSKEGVKHIKNNRYEEYKYGNNRIVRIEIKRSVITVDLFFINSDVKELMSDSNVKVKEASTTLKVIDDSSYELALGSIDMVYSQILQEIERKKIAKREKRKALRNQANS